MDPTPCRLGVPLRLWSFLSVLYPSLWHFGVRNLCRDALLVVIKIMARVRGGGASAFVVVVFHFVVSSSIAPGWYRGPRELTSAQSLHFRDLPRLLSRYHIHTPGAWPHANELSG